MLINKLSKTRKNQYKLNLFAMKKSPSLAMSRRVNYIGEITLSEMDKNIMNNLISLVESGNKVKSLQIIRKTLDKTFSMNHCLGFYYWMVERFVNNKHEFYPSFVERFVNNKREFYTTF